MSNDFEEQNTYERNNQMHKNLSETNCFEAWKFQFIMPVVNDFRELIIFINIFNGIYSIYCKNEKNFKGSKRKTKRYAGRTKIQRNIPIISKI